MAIYQSRPTTIDAEQFEHPATSPRGVRTEENGRAYVVTIQEQRVYVSPGEWIVDEGDGIHFYPIADEVFRRRYERQPDGVAARAARFNCALNEGR